MTYRGIVRNGVVVLDGIDRPQDGTIVWVEPVEPAGQVPPRGSADAVMRHAGFWADQVEDVDRSLDELRRMKQEELANQRDDSL